MVSCFQSDAGTASCCANEGTTEQNTKIAADAIRKRTDCSGNDVGSIPFRAVRVNGLNSGTNVGARAAVSVVACAMLCVPAFAAAQEIASEYRLKAAFLYRFPQFVEWPASAWQNTATVQLCVAEPNPFGTELAQLLRGESLNGRPLAVRMVSATPDVTGCHLLFLAERSPRADDLLKAAAALPVLTVGESSTFLENGGIIAFRIVDRRVRFDVNPSNAQRRGMRISSQLLRLALSVQGGGR
jgi:hypothetical protein